MTSLTQQQQDEITALIEKRELIKKLQREVAETMQKLSPEQYQEFQDRVLAKMTPEQQAQAKAQAALIQQQLAGAPKVSPLEELIITAKEAFQAANEAVKADPNATAEQKINLAHAAAQTTSAAAAVESALIENDKLAITLQQQNKGAKPGPKKINDIGGFGFVDPKKLPKARQP